MLHEQAFVAGGSHLSHENHIIRINDRLVLVGKIRMDSVTHFVRKGEFAVKGVLMVQQDIGVNSCTCGIRAAALSLILVNVYPAVFKALFEYRKVILAHRCKGFQDSFLSLLKCYLHICVRNNRSIKVIEMKLVNAQKLLSQSNIIVHIVHIVMYGFNKVFVH